MISADMLEIHISCYNLLTDIVIVHLNMFGTSMKNRILSQLNTAGINTKDPHRFNIGTEILEYPHLGHTALC